LEKALGTRHLALGERHSKGSGGIRHLWFGIRGEACRYVALSASGRMPNA
jgi:hypothetical protein